MLGGIGFTWEHDAHLYLRRAIALRQLLGGASPWRRGRWPAPRSAAPGATSRSTCRRRPRPLRAEVARRRRRDRRAARGASAARRLVDAGLHRAALAAAVGPRRRRGRAARHRRGAAPGRGPGAAPPGRGVGGADDRRPRHRRAAGALGAARRCAARSAWCQLFSEPEAGSDLAALTTTATRTDGGWLLNGQKVWTTHGQGGRLGHLPGPHQPDGAEAPRHHLLHRRHEARRASTSGRSRS